jgi:predicted nucleotidyltransferase component of viral defense system
MKPELYYNTVKPRLKTVLNELMQLEEFKMFRLVGGTALSLQFGHRISVDIDLFTDCDYGSLDFEKLTHKLQSKYGKIRQNQLEIIGMGKSISINPDSKDAVKLDVYYTDPFVFPLLEIDGIRMASPEEIAAMKLEILLKGGRKKDFWDIHELLEKFTFKQMISFHEKRYYSAESYSHWKSCLINYENADDDNEPECLRGKHWNLIKLDLIDFANGK